jgi:hypothetical protein
MTGERVDWRVRAWPQLLLQSTPLNLFMRGRRIVCVNHRRLVVRPFATHFRAVAANIVAVHVDAIQQLIDRAATLRNYMCAFLRVGKTASYRSTS